MCVRMGNMYFIKLDLNSNMTIYGGCSHPKAVWLEKEEDPVSSVTSSRALNVCVWGVVVFLGFILVS